MLGRTTGLDRRRAKPPPDARYTAGVGGEYPIHGVLVITVRSAGPGAPVCFWQAGKTSG